MPTKAEKEGLLPRVTSKDRALVESAPSLPIFDLQRLNLLELSRGLEESLKKPKPRSYIFKWWGGVKQELDAENQRWILDQITNMRSINVELVNLQADMFLSVEMVTNLVDGYRDNARREWELAVKEHEAKIYSLDKDMDERDLLIDKLRAEISGIQIQNAAVAQKVALMKKVVESFDDLPNYLKLLISKAVFDDRTEVADSPYMMDALEKAAGDKVAAEVRKDMAEAELAEEKAKQEREETEWKKFKRKRGENGYKSGDSG